MELRGDEAEQWKRRICRLSADTSGHNRQSTARKRNVVGTRQIPSGWGRPRLSPCPTCCAGYRGDEWSQLRTFIEAQRRLLGGGSWLPGEDFRYTEPQTSSFGTSVYIVRVQDKIDKRYRPS